MTRKCVDCGVEIRRRASRNDVLYGATVYSAGVLLGTSVPWPWAGALALAACGVSIAGLLVSAKEQRRVHTP